MKNYSVKLKQTTLRLFGVTIQVNLLPSLEELENEISDEYKIHLGKLSIILIVISSLFLASCGSRSNGNSNELPIPSKLPTDYIQLYPSRDKVYACCFTNGKTTDESYIILEENNRYKINLLHKGYYAVDGQTIITGEYKITSPLTKEKSDYYYFENHKLDFIVKSFTYDPKSDILETIKPGDVFHGEISKHLDRYGYVIRIKGIRSYYSAGETYDELMFAKE
jgi:hypothetical protein